MERAMSVLQIPMKESWLEAVRSLNDSSLDLGVLREKVARLSQEDNNPTSITPIEYLALKHQLSVLGQLSEYSMLTKISEMVYSIDAVLSQKLADLSRSSTTGSSDQNEIAIKKSYRALMRMVE